MIDHESTNLTFITADLILNHMTRNLEYLKPSSKSNAVSSERTEIGLLCGYNMSRGFVVIFGHNTSSSSSSFFKLELSRCVSLNTQKYGQSKTQQFYCLICKLGY